LVDEKDLVRMRYTLDLSNFKLGVVIQQGLMKAFRGMIKKMIPKEDNPKILINKPSLYVVEFDGDPKQVKAYRRTLWGVSKTYGLAGVKFSFEEVNKSD